MRNSAFALLAAVPLAWASAGPAPQELSASAAKAGINGPFAAWCRGEFRAGHAGAFAVALPAARGAGRYLVIEPDGTRFDLAPFKGGADVSCHTPAEARRLSESIAQSGIIHGAVAPAWQTTVVCAFVEDTNAVCWQYSPASGEFVKVGEWLT